MTLLYQNMDLFGMLDFVPDSYQLYLNRGSQKERTEAQVQVETKLTTKTRKNKK